MGVSIVRFQHEGEARWGVKTSDNIALLPEHYPSHRELMADYFSDSKGFIEKAHGSLSCDVVQYLAPVSSDIQLFCQGLNYGSHREEGGLSAEAETEENLIFMKPASTICGPNDDIIKPKNCELLDYEVELALVIKNDLPSDQKVHSGNLMDYVAGVTLCNDVSARDMMFGAPVMQWFKGKGQRTFCPTGPVLYLMEPNEAELLNQLQLQLHLNNDLRQDAITGDMIHKPAKTLTELASFTDVKQGDMVLTGTPGGVIMNMSFKLGLAVMLNLGNDKKRRAKIVRSQAKIRYLQPGDKLKLSLVSIDGKLDLGQHNNTIVGA